VWGDWAKQQREHASVRNAAAHAFIFVTPRFQFWVSLGRGT
jgi:hypothetical protein